MGSGGCEGGHGEAEAEEHAFRRVLERIPSRDGIHLSESPLCWKKVRAKDKISPPQQKSERIFVVEGRRFELLVVLPTYAFQAYALDRYANPPYF